MSDSEPVTPAPTCTACARELRPDAAFCDNCGHPVHPQVECAVCGETDHLPDARFCLSCGSALPSREAPIASHDTGAEPEEDEPPTLPRIPVRPLAIIGALALAGSTALPWFKRSGSTAWEIELQLLTGRRPDASDDWLSLGLVVAVAGGLALLLALTKLRYGPYRWAAVGGLGFVLWFGDYLDLFSKYPGDALNSMASGPFVAAGGALLLMLPQWQPRARGVRLATAPRWRSVAVIALVIAVLGSSTVFAEVSSLDPSVAVDTTPPTDDPAALPVGDDQRPEQRTIAAPGPAPPWIPAAGINEVDPNAGFVIEGSNGIVYGYANGSLVAMNPDSGDLWEGGIVAGRIVESEFLLSGDAPQATIEWATGVLDADPRFARGGRGWLAIADAEVGPAHTEANRVQGGFWTTRGPDAEVVLVHSDGGEYVFVEAAEDHAWIIDDEQAVMLVPQGDTLAVAGALTATDRIVEFEPSPVADAATLAMATQILGDAFADEVADHLVMEQQQDGTLLVAQSGSALANAELSDIKFWFGCGWCNKAKNSVVKGTKATVDAGTNAATAVGGAVKDGVVTGTGAAIDAGEAVVTGVKETGQAVGREVKEQAVRTGNGMVAAYNHAESGVVSTYNTAETAVVRSYEYVEGSVISLGEATIDGLQTGWVYVKKGAVAGWRVIVTVGGFVVSAIWAFFDHALERKCTSSSDPVRWYFELTWSGSPGPGKNSLGTGRPDHPAPGYQPLPENKELLDLARAWMPPVQLSRDETCGEIIRIAARVFPYAADGALITAPPYLEQAERVEIVYTIFFRNDGGRFCGLIASVLFGPMAPLFQQDPILPCGTHAGDNEGLGVALIRSDRTDGRCGLTDPAFELVGARSSGHSDAGPAEFINRVTISNLDTSRVGVCPRETPSWQQDRSDAYVSSPPRVSEGTAYKIWSAENKHALYWDRNACEREIFSTAILFEDLPQWAQWFLPEQGSEECEGGRQPYDLNNWLELFTTESAQAWEAAGWCLLEPTPEGFPPQEYYDRGGPAAYFLHEGEYKAFACQTRGKPWWEVDERYRVQLPQFTNPQLTVPNVEGMTIENATALLDNYHLGLVAVDIESVAIGDPRHRTVKEQLTRPGTIITGVPSGDEPTFVIGVVVYIANKHEVPDFKGMTIEEARSIAGSGYQVFDGGPYVGAGDEFLGVIAYQIPDPGTLIDVGDIVTVYIGAQDAPPPTTTTTTTTKAPAPNNPPKAVDDSSRNDTTIEPDEIDTWQPVFVLSNDSDPDGDPLEVTSLRCVSEEASCDYIQWRIHSSGDYIEVKALTTSPDSYQYRVLEYTVSDGRGGTDTEKVYLDIYYV